MNEYYSGRLAIDVTNSGLALLREWIDESEATPQDLDALALHGEQAWADERGGCVAY